MPSEKILIKTRKEHTIYIPGGQMNKDVYYEYNPWWEGEPGLENKIERPVVLDKMEKFFESPGIVLLTGLRRVGKTTLMKLFIRRLIQRGINPGHIFYVSFDDYVLDPKSIIEVTAEYRTLHKLPVEEKVYLFFDEISHKEKFHQQLKNLDPVYVFENQLEIDFYLNNKVLVEVKYGEELRDKQRELFEKFKADHKLVVKGYDNLAELESLLK
jgi:predicted AAA+ superfamily ATPase